MSLIILFGALSVALPGEEALSGDARIVGPEEIVFDWSEQACDREDIPDIPTRAFRDGRGRVQLIASHHANRRMIGPDLDHLTRDCTIIMSSHRDPDPTKFNNYEWIHAVYTTDGVNVFALVSNEFRGHHYPTKCPSGVYRECWYNSITFAVSRNGGDSYAQVRPPGHLVATIPYPYEPDAGPIGVFGGSNIVHNARDGYYYALLHVEAHQDQQWGTCVMRTRNLADPKSWRAWDGHGFHVEFINPYLKPRAQRSSHVCQPVSRSEIQKMSQSLTFNTYFNRFLLVGLASPPVPGEEPHVSGIYYSLSDDLIHWTPRRLIVEVETPNSYTCGDRNPILYPSVLDPESPSRNFETTGQRVYLYFTRFNHTDCRSPLNRDLVRVPIEFSR